MGRWLQASILHSQALLLMLWAQALALLSAPRPMWRYFLLLQRWYCGSVLSWHQCAVGFSSSCTPPTAATIGRCSYQPLQAALLCKAELVALAVVLVALPGTGMGMGMGMGCKATHCTLLAASPAVVVVVA